MRLAANPCPLCGGELYPFSHDQRRSYLRCRRCWLVTVPPCFWLDAEAEREEYDRHQNDPYDAGYQRFLNRLATPLLARLPTAASGLDFGCGPGPALALLLRERGHRVLLHDRFYAPCRAALRQPHDFITATEVVEHLQHPRTTLFQLWSLLKPGGWFGIMTKLVQSPARFEQWHYRRDPTHIHFFSRTTFAWLARQWRAAWWQPASDVILLQKPHHPPH